MKVLISLDDRLLARIDRAAGALGLTRSAYIARLAESELALRGGSGATPTARGAVDRLQRLFRTNPSGEESTAAVRAARDERTASR